MKQKSKPPAPIQLKPDIGAWQIKKEFESICLAIERLKKRRFQMSSAEFNKEADSIQLRMDLLNEII